MDGIVTVISEAGRVGEPNYAVYSGAKAGAAGFMRALAKGLGRHMITANCVSLAGVATPGLADRNADPEMVKKKLSRYVIRRLGEPRDASAMILYPRLRRRKLDHRPDLCGERRLRDRAIRRERSHARSRLFRRG